MVAQPTMTSPRSSWADCPGAAPWNSSPSASDTSPSRRSTRHGTAGEWYRIDGNPSATDAQVEAADAVFVDHFIDTHEEAVTPALDQVWEGRLTAQQGADLAVKNAEPLLQGRW